MLIAAIALTSFGIGTAWSARILKQQTGRYSPAAEPKPSKIGDIEVGIVDHRLFELDQRAEKLKFDEQQRLNSYGWVDRKAGLIHIPIARAIDLILEESQ